MTEEEKVSLLQVAIAMILLKKAVNRIVPFREVTEELFRVQDKLQKKTGKDLIRIKPLLYWMMGTINLTEKEIEECKEIIQQAFRENSQEEVEIIKEIAEILKLDLKQIGILQSPPFAGPRAAHLFFRKGSPPY